jgi:3-hydroxy-9,10-secoandrosta-1,3,5(10)-triene-9,17-dione monooxygenase
MNQYVATEDVSVLSAAAHPQAGVTADTMIRRAAALRPLLREQQEEADERGYYGNEVHQALLDTGLYRMVQPRMFGGYEFDLPTYLRVIIEISRGHPSSGWCYTLAASHALVVGAQWPEKAQVELFGPDGDFRAPHRAAPAGTFERADGGYKVSGTWTYASGIPVSTHFIGAAVLRRGEDKPPRVVNFIVRRDQLKILDDWGGDRVLGMRGSGSNSVEITDVFVPDHHIIDAGVLLTSDPDGNGTPGTILHRNPMFLGVLGGAYHATFGSILVGTARAALEEYEQILRTKRVFGNPAIKRLDDPESQQNFGKALQLTDAAEAVTIRAGQIYMEQCDRWAKNGTPITAEDTLRLWGIAQEGCKMACRAVELLYYTSSVASANRGEPLQRYFRDIQMYLIHPSAQASISTAIGQANLGMPVDLFGQNKTS